MTMHTLFAAAGLVAAAGSLATAQTSDQPLFPPPAAVFSTIPSNGDVNPYGVAFTPRNVPADGLLKPGDILVSNFNNSQNLQGTGTTIIRVSARGAVSTFFQGKTGLGLTAALGVVRAGFVFVGNLPTTDGTSATIQPTSLLVIDRKGNLLGSLSDKNLVAGPWGMAINDLGTAAQIFYTNVLNGTVTRLNVAFSEDGESLAVRSALQIAAGFNFRTDPAALVLGPSGLVYDAQHDILYIASSLDNTVYAVHDAGSRTDAGEGTGAVVIRDPNHLHGPLDLALAPNGHLIVANSDGSNIDPNQPSELAEFTVNGQFVAQHSVDPNNGGAFGVGLRSIGGGAAVRFAAVNDNQNQLIVWTIPLSF